MSVALRAPCDETAIRSGGPASRCPPARRRWVLATAILGSSMAFIDGTVVNVALPALQASLGATLHQAQWVVESYALLLAALLLLGGALGDRFGRRRIFVIGVVVFGVASLACALSRDVHALILARAVQGVGGALLVPGSLALISAAFDEHERGKAIGTWAGFSGVTTALGPVLGGYLVDRYSWVWAFLVNVPLAIAVLAMALLRVDESRDPHAPARLDWGGAALATLGLGGIVFGFIEAPTRGWGSPAVLAALGLGLAALAAFVATERHAAAPMLPMRFFRNRNFAGANALTLLLYAALGGGLFFLPLALIQVHGYSAAGAGAALLPFILIMFALSRAAGRLADRIGPRPPLVAGPLIAAAGFGLLAVPGIGGSYWSHFLPGIVVLGLGMTLTVAPLTTTVMNAAGAEAAGTASGINNAVSRVAGLLAVAVFGTLMTWAFDAALPGQLQHLQVPPDITALVLRQHDRLAAIELPSGIDASAAHAARQAVGEAFIAGFRWVMLASAACCLAGAAAAGALVRQPASTGPSPA
ncbi:MAG: MFS transporter [Burkholderiales bacterium]